jgi:preprotein translocase subunit YajC
VSLAAASQGGGSSWTLLLMMALIFGAMYFLMIRPQQRRRRQAESMQSSLGPGDEVVTIGGLYGIVTSVDDDAVMLEVAPGVENRYARGAISRVVTTTEHEAAQADAEADEPDDVIDAEEIPTPDTKAADVKDGRP